MKTSILIATAILSAIPLALFIIWNLPGLGLLLGFGLIAYALSRKEFKGGGPGKVHVMERMGETGHRRAA